MISSLHGGCTAKGRTDVKNAAAGFVDCTKINVQQAIGDVPLLKKVADDLVGSDYMQAIADLITKVGSNEVACAVVAVEQVVAAGKTSGAAALSPIELRAREVLVKYAWKFAQGGPK